MCRWLLIFVKSWDVKQNVNIACRIMASDLQNSCIVLMCIIFLSLSGIETTDFKIGVLGPWDTPGSHIYPLLGSRTVRAVPLAIEQVHDQGILGNHTLSFVYRDTKCDARRASGSAVDLHLMHSVYALIGPPCSEGCRGVRDLTAYWDMPLVSWFCPSVQATTPDDPYQSFARTFVPFSCISQLPQAVMDIYQWNSASLVYARSPPWDELQENVLQSMINSGKIISNIQGYDRPLDVAGAVEILQSLKRVSHGESTAWFVCFIQ